MGFRYREALSDAVQHFRIAHELGVVPPVCVFEFSICFLSVQHTYICSKYTHTHTYTQIYICIYINSQTRTYTHTLIHTHSNKHTHTHTHTHTHGTHTRRAHTHRLHVALSSTYIPYVSVCKKIRVYVYYIHTCIEAHVKELLQKACIHTRTRAHKHTCCRKKACIQ